MSVRRNIKNVVYNYSDAARKVREATSNDPWGPSTTLMQNIAELTYNMVAFSEIMAIVWKRLNDHGRNWRHVYKSLVLLDYLVKYGSRRVAQQCKENIFAIQTLKDFQYIEGNKDQGLNVREKAKQLVALLKDDERLKNERAKAEALRQRFAQEHGQPVGYESNLAASSVRAANFESSSFPAYDGGIYVQYEADPLHFKDYARPENAEEEALQVQLALALSKQEADEEEKLRKSDYIKLSLAMSESLRNDKGEPASNQPHQKSLLHDTGKHASESDIVGLFDVWADSKPSTGAEGSGKETSSTDWPLLNVVGTESASGSNLHNRPVSANPWISQHYYDPSSSQKNRDIWNTPSGPWEPLAASDKGSIEEDPWGLPGTAILKTTDSSSIPPSSKESTESKGIDITTAALLKRQERVHIISSPEHTESSGQSFDYYNLTGALAPSANKLESTSTEHKSAKLPGSRSDDFLGEHKDLVNLDDLISNLHEERSKNPFLATGSSSTSNPLTMPQSRPAFPSTSNPFASAANRGPTLNELSSNTKNTSNSGQAAGESKPNPFA
ncbi:hypothetical protein ACOME3_009985 [Neoechinorhynchus agilis]